LIDRRKTFYNKKNRMIKTDYSLFFIKARRVNTMLTKHLHGVLFEPMLVRGLMGGLKIQPTLMAQVELGTLLAVVAITERGKRALFKSSKNKTFLKVKNTLFYVLKTESAFVTRC